MARSERSHDGEHFHHPVSILDTDIDANGHVNNVTYIRWVQEAAAAHWGAVVEPSAAVGLSWVVLRHEVDYQVPAFLGDSLLVKTWVGEMSAVTSVRFCEVLRNSDGAVLARSRTVWCAIDAKTGRPKRVGSEIRSLFFREPAPE